MRNARRMKLRIDETRAKRWSVVIACAALAALVTASSYAAVRAWIKPDPASEVAAAPPPVQPQHPHEGLVIYRRGEEGACQHKTFDNDSGKLSKAIPGPCDYAKSKSHQETPVGFSWGTK
jgi:hypothetical protein